jgi:hypothetical protein
MAVITEPLLLSAVFSNSSAVHVVRIGVPAARFMIQIKQAPGAPLGPLQAMTWASCRNYQLCVLTFDRI